MGWIRVVAIHFRVVINNDYCLEKKCDNWSRSPALPFHNLLVDSTLLVLQHHCSSSCTDSSSKPNSQMMSFIVLSPAFSIYRHPEFSVVAVLPQVRHLQQSISENKPFVTSLVEFEYTVMRTRVPFSLEGILLSKRLFCDCNLSGLCQ